MSTKQFDAEQLSDLVKDNTFGLKEIPPEQSLIEYPTDFPIKVMAQAHPELIDVLTELVLEHDPEFKKETIEVRPSSKGNYTGLTFIVRATSREQLDTIYRTLHGHELVKVVL
ncbi:DUF493 family protein [Pelistega sp. NLN82]|uniref:UPF0250 protein F9B74_04410 n=1 Tax=Pelistega ratti TaxID=2652177 RepID=A0A6L9Y590_9BURK|nr:DUF493 family protein [Pelistega ratti]NEN75571.1 DUF493 family protein [Pelistega ratti]